MSECVFCKIITKTIPAKIIFEDDEILAFYDANPKAEVHFMIIPKDHIESMICLEHHHQNLMGKIMVKANELAVSLGLKEGYKVQINTGAKGGQEVLHLHVHVLGNRFI